MDFNTLIKTRIFPILYKYGFKLHEEFRNIVRVKSTNIEMNFAFNDRENSCYISIGRVGQSSFELRNNAVRNLLNSSLIIEQLPPEPFTHNLCLLLETTEGSELLKGNINDFIKFKILEDEDYTSKLLLKQTLELASKAWICKDYSGFIEIINTLEISKLPKSYKLKYKIAKQSLE